MLSVSLAARALKSKTYMVTGTCPSTEMATKTAIRAEVRSRYHFPEVGLVLGALAGSIASPLGVLVGAGVGLIAGLNREEQLVTQRLAADAECGEFSPRRRN